MRTDFLKRAGWTLVAIFGFLIVFQLLLFLGVEIPGSAWGSRNEVLTPGLRMASFAAAWILAFILCVVLEKIKVVSLIRKPRLINSILWFFSAYFLLNTFLNALSPGKIEKYFMTPLALTASILCMVVAKGKFR